MTKEEIIQAISGDKMIPFIQLDQLSEIVDFVIKNYILSLPSNLDEAIEEYAPDFSNDFASKAAVEAIRDAFKAGAKWMAGQGVKFDTEMSWLDSFGFQIGWPEDTSIFDCFNEGDKVVVQIRKKQ